MKVNYTKAEGKNTYTANFRHSVVKDSEGKYGKKIHRSLCTEDETVAKEMAENLEELLNNEKWWDVTHRGEAERRYGEVVADIFYAPMDDGSVDTDELVNDEIPMPDPSEDFLRIAMLGATGSGKSSLVREILGTSKEHFPTTAAGRTTTCDFQAISNDQEEFDGIVAFQSKRYVEAQVLECITNAVEEAVKGENDDKIADKLLIAKDLTFRLTYILGAFSSEAEIDDDDFGGNEDDSDPDFSELQNPDDLQTKIKSFIAQIRAIADRLKVNNIDVKQDDFNPEEQDDFLQLQDEIMNEIIARFSILDKDGILDSQGKWVNVYACHIPERKEFIKYMKLFTSNYKSAWGSLLSPIVKTVRIRGRFNEGYAGDQKMVILDGQGQGHKVTATSVSTDNVANIVNNADVVLIADNAEQPMLENTKMVLRAVIELGFGKRCYLGFTHMDSLNGANLISGADKKKHVSASVEAYMSALREQEPDVLSESHRQSILSNCFYFAGLNKTGDKPKGTMQNMAKMLESMKECRKRLVVEEMALEYDSMTLYAHLQDAMAEFHDVWSKRLGYPSISEITEHWSRIKALSRRLAQLGEDNYNNELAPLADFRQIIASQLNVFFNKPIRCLSERASDHDVENYIDILKGEINAKLLGFIKETLWTDKEQLARWNEAYNYRGRYSTNYRAVRISEIFDVGAPEIDKFAYNMTEIQKVYVKEIINMVEEVLKSHGSSLTTFRY